jgi:hypothetical protein
MSRLDKITIEVPGMHAAIVRARTPTGPVDA